MGLSVLVFSDMFQKKLGNEWIAIDDYTQDAAIPDAPSSEHH